MFNAEEVRDGLMGIVGWEQNYDSTGFQVSAPLAASSSGVYFNHQHPDLTIDNLISAAPEYVRLGDDATVQAAKFNTWLEARTKAGIVRGLQQWLETKQIERSGRNILDRAELFTVSNSTNNLDPDTGDLVGIELRPLNSMSVLYEVHKIGLQLSAAQSPSLTVYLFHSDDPAPKESATVTYDTANKLIWHDLEEPWEISGRGTWYIGYLQDDLVGQSINGVYDYNYQDLGMLSFPIGAAAKATAFKASHAAATLWPIQNNQYTIGTNYGLNLSLTAKCDYTGLILEQKAIFWNVIAKAVALDFLQLVRKNPNARTNKNTENVDKEETHFDIHGDPRGKPSGLQHELRQAIKAVLLDERSIDKVCLPCQKTGAKWLT